MKKETILLQIKDSQEARPLPAPEARIRRMATVRELLDQGRSTLSRPGLDRPAREAALLLGRLLDLSEAQVLAREREPVAPEQVHRYRELLSRRRDGEPIAYLLGEREFFGRDFAVDRRVLIPRPETEHLVELALALPLPDDTRAIDIGTGSGCLAVTLAAERPGWRIVATDLSVAALDVARGNSRRHRVSDRVCLLAADLAAPVDLSAFQLVVGNPPYVEEEVVSHLSPEVRDFEPRVALVGGRGGLETLDRLLGELTTLPPGSWALLEFGFGQADSVALLAERTGAFDRVEIRPDLAGIERDVVLRRRA
jgi:release factor glutamine methyltransferase